MDIEVLGKINVFLPHLNHFKVAMGCLHPHAMSRSKHRSSLEELNFSLDLKEFPQKPQEKNHFIVLIFKEIRKFWKDKGVRNYKE